jgi:hypothetical protein
MSEDTAHPTDGLLEQLAALEHEQWARWTEHMLNNLTPDNIARWRRQIDTPYASLSEQEKESDREWARRILALLRSAGYPLPPQQP